MPLQPYRPSARAPWDEERAAHLARRSGFGATAEEIAHLTQAGLEGAVTARVDYPDAEPELEALVRSNGTPLLRNGPQAEQAAQGVMRLRQLWLFRMAYGSAPLREKLALLWHDHFATQQQKVVREELVFAHLETLRRLGAARMRELLGAVARDPAMLVFLDNRLSQKTKPNENWARELLELFSVGLGPYDQADVRALARVFTGWTTPKAHLPEFLFDPELHDGGDKRVLGRSIRGRRGEAGIEEGEEVLDMLASHPACTRSIATKLARWFVTHTPPEGLIASIDSDLAANGGSIRETLRALFSSEAFYAPEFRFCLHKHPVEYAVSAARALGVQNLHLCALPGRLARMGMDLFEPPSVAGWEHGRAWVQSNHMIERFDLAATFAALPHTTRRVAGAAALDFDALVPEGAETTEWVEALSQRLLGRALPESSRKALAAYMEASPNTRRRDYLRGLVHLMLFTPEFALA